mmetsp:Transcript_32599/g.77061  ORF Transcript_32599/g.77061 Transcript_32599/m.77061 type:complete len:226 (+) Transcript_32599:514-1191(+)
MAGVEPDGWRQGRGRHHPPRDRRDQRLAHLDDGPRGRTVARRDHRNAGAGRGAGRSARDHIQRGGAGGGGRRRHAARRAADRLHRGPAVSGGGAALLRARPDQDHLRHRLLHADEHRCPPPHPVGQGSALDRPLPDGSRAAGDLCARGCGGLLRHGHQLVPGQPRHDWLGARDFRARCLRRLHRGRPLRVRLQRSPRAALARRRARHVGRPHAAPHQGACGARRA